MQCVLIKHCKPSEFLDSSGCLAFISVCFMSVLWFNFCSFFIVCVSCSFCGLIFVPFLFCTDNCTVASNSSKVSCKRY